MAKDTLPPAGDERTDELKRRLDDLTQQAEELASQTGQERADPAKMRIDREVAQHAFDADLAIRHPDANYHYTWVYRDPFNKYGGRTVHKYESQGWEIVHPSDPDGRGMRPGVDNTCVNADCVLMRQRKDVHLLAEQAKRARRRAIQDGHASTLQEMADRKGIVVHTDYGSMPDSVKSAVASGQRNARAAAVLNSPSLARDIRAGTIPGMPAPGR